MLRNVFDHIDFNKQVGGKSTLSDLQLRQLIEHFDKQPLMNEDLEFADLLGAAYKYLIHFLARFCREERGRVLYPTSGCEANGADCEPAGRHGGV